MIPPVDKILSVSFRENLMTVRKNRMNGAISHEVPQISGLLFCIYMVKYSSINHNTKQKGYNKWRSNVTWRKN